MQKSHTNSAPRTESKPRTDWGPRDPTTIHVVGTNGPQSKITEDHGLFPPPTAPRARSSPRRQIHLLGVLSPLALSWQVGRQPHEGGHRSEVAQWRRPSLCHGESQTPHPRKHALGCQETRPLIPPSRTNLVA
jgi:hypothetical protein